MGAVCAKNDEWLIILIARFCNLKSLSKCVIAAFPQTERP